MTKDEVRKLIRERERELPLSYKKEADARIRERLAALAAFQAAGTVFAYAAMPSEIGLDPFLALTLSLGKRLLVPRCEPNRRLALVEIESLADLEKGSFGIREPKRTCREAQKNEIDFAVIPCLSCNLAGDRLGRGGGYYDRFLKDAPFAMAMACRSRLLYENIPMEEHDVRIPLVITD